MGYSIEDCSGEPSQLDEIAEFLATFVSDGEGPSGDEAESTPERWRERLRWWWETNPYCREDSPRALLLRDEDRTIVGVFGFVPHDYDCGGERVPSLILTTTFVRKSSRSAALGLWMRAHRLAEKFHLVDGGPNAEVQQLLRKTGYESAAGARLLFFPVRRPIDGLRPLGLRVARAFAHEGYSSCLAGRLIGSLDEVTSVPPARSENDIRKHVDIESLRWYLASGSKPKHFLGWVDEKGSLLAYLIGIVRQKCGVRCLFVIDGGTFGGAEEVLLSALASQAASRPDEAGIPKEADVVALPLDASAPGARSPLSLDYNHKVFYRLPRSLAGTERTCLPWEGDQILL